jgi:hypothetical protein
LRSGNYYLNVLYNENTLPHIWFGGTYHTDPCDSNLGSFSDQVCLIPLRESGLFLATFISGKLLPWTWNLKRLFDCTFPLKLTDNARRLDPDLRGRRFADARTPYKEPRGGASCQLSMNPSFEGETRAPVKFVTSHLREKECANSD